MIKKAYSVKLTNYTAENMDKDYLIKTLKGKLESVNRIISDAEKDKKELEETITEAEKL